MKWNWQSKDWPSFRFDLEELSVFEQEFFKNSGLLVGAFKHIEQDEKSNLIVEIIADEALKTSEIEGEYLNRASVQSSIRKQFGLETNIGKVPAAEQGIAEMMVDVYQTFSEPLTHEAIFRWHEMLTKGRRDLTDIGRYRTGSDDMQVVSGPINRPIVHFEAPPSDTLTGEMNAFLDWFESSGPKGNKKLGPLIRAGIAHLYFVSIHPMEDGNGRIGRAIAEKSLAQSLGQPSLIALSFVIEKHKKDYYAALERNNTQIEITDWLMYFSETIIKAQVRTLELVDFIIKKTKLYDKVRTQLNERQEKLLSRIFREGPEGFKGGLSVKNYLSITGASRATATRDLQYLVDLEVLTKTGELKGTRYYLNLPK
jgi:Fic family protein